MVPDSSISFGPLRKDPLGGLIDPILTRYSNMDPSRVAFIANEGDSSVGKVVLFFSCACLLTKIAEKNDVEVLLAAAGVDELERSIHGLLLIPVFSLFLIVSSGVSWLSKQQAAHPTSQNAVAE
jgi:hypothetical protein